MTGPAATGGRRRSASGGRASWTAVLAVLLPLLTTGALLLVDPVSPSEPAAAPARRTPLTRADLGCPAALPGTERVRVATTGTASGTVTVRSLTGGREREVPLRPGGQAGADVAGAARVTAYDDLAPGLLGARAGGTPLAATPCPAPAGTAWFSGLGADFEHRSVLELVNPDRGVAVADVAVHGPDGPVDAPRLRGLSVPGNGALRVDLAERLPRAGLLSVGVRVSRGRLSATVADELSRPGAGRVADWVPATDAARERSLLLGLARGGGIRRLALTNPGGSEARVRVRLVTARSTFSPTGSEEVRVPPGELVTVALDDLGREVRNGALGLLVEADAPVVAGLGQLVDGDVVHSAPVAAFRGTGATVLPGGRSRLVLGGATRFGRATVVARAEGGAELLRRTVEVGAERAVAVDLPERAASVAVTATGTSVAGVVHLEGTGDAVLPLVRPAENGRVPSVRPAPR